MWYKNSGNHQGAASTVSQVNEEFRFEARVSVSCMVKRFNIATMAPISTSVLERIALPAIALYLVLFQMLSL